MKKRIVIATAVALATAILIGRNTATAETRTEDSTVEFYQELAENLDILQVYDSSKLTIEDLQNRDGKIFIEECIGVVTANDGSGKLLNCNSGYYISYASVENAEVGDVVLTYFIYNPDTEYEDDIIARYDYIIDTGYEVEECGK